MLEICHSDQNEKNKKLEHNTSIQGFFVEIIFQNAMHSQFQ